MNSAVTASRSPITASNRLAVDGGLAEVEGRQPQQVAAELHRDAGVQPVLRAQPRRILGAAAAHLRHQRIHRIARRQLQQQEQADQDDRRGPAASGGQAAERQSAEALQAGASQTSCQLLLAQRGVLWLFISRLE